MPGRTNRPQVTLDIDLSRVMQVREAMEVGWSLHGAERIVVYVVRESQDGSAHVQGAFVVDESFDDYTTNVVLAFKPR